MLLRKVPLGWLAIRFEPGGTGNGRGSTPQPSAIFRKCGRVDEGNRLLTGTFERARRFESFHFRQNSVGISVYPPRRPALSLSRREMFQVTYSAVAKSGKASSFEVEYCRFKSCPRCHYA